MTAEINVQDLADNLQSYLELVEAGQSLIILKAGKRVAEIKHRGLEALLERLGPVGMIRFLQQFETGHSDYTVERESWLTEIDLDALADKIRQERMAAGNDD